MSSQRLKDNLPIVSCLMLDSDGNQRAFNERRFAGGDQPLVDADHACYELAQSLGIMHRGVDFATDAKDVFGALTPTGNTLYEIILSLVEAGRLIEVVPQDSDAPPFYAWADSHYEWMHTGPGAEPRVLEKTMDDVTVPTLKDLMLDGLNPPTELSKWKMNPSRYSFHITEDELRAAVAICIGLFEIGKFPETGNVGCLVDWTYLSETELAYVDNTIDLLITLGVIQVNWPEDDREKRYRWNTNWRGGWRNEIPEMSYAPWTDVEVVSINCYQVSGLGHSYHCATKEKHPNETVTYQGEGEPFTVTAPTGGVLVATPNGLVCTVCDYKQDTVHKWVADGRWRDMLEQRNLLLGITPSSPPPFRVVAEA